MRSKKLAFFLLFMVLLTMVLFLSGCDDGDGDDPPESFLKMLFNIFLVSAFIFTGTSIMNNRNSKKGNSVHK
ncbi:MAG: hypothetical protein ABRQ37_04585 [Candidatus Eremiobacterota bacterium]